MNVVVFFYEFNVFIIWLGSLLLNIFVTVRIKLFKKREENNFLISNKKNKNNVFLFSIENQAVDSFGLFLVLSFSFVWSVFTLFKVISFSASEILTFPNNLYVHFYLLVNPVLFGSVGIITYFIKHFKMRHFIQMELRRMKCYE